MRYLRRFSLNSKLILFIGLAVLIISSMAMILAREFVNRTIFDMYQENLRADSQLLELSLHDAFMQQDMTSVQRILDNVATQNQSEAIRVLNQQGEVLASSAPDEVGVKMKLTGDSCSACHDAGLAQLPASMRFPGDVNSENGEEIVYIANGLDNQVACQSCHDQDGRSLGVILATYRSGPIQSWSYRIERGLGYGATGLTVLLILTLGIILARNITSPLNRLMKGKPEALVSREDEWGGLARQILKTQADLEERDHEVVFQRRSFDVLLSMLEAMDEAMTIQQVFNIALRAVQKATGFSSVAMRLRDEKRNCFRLISQNGMSPEMVEELVCIPADQGFPKEVLKTKQPVFSSDLGEDPRLGGQSPLRVGYRSLVSIPILAGDHVLGSMELAIKEKHDWEKDELRWLALVGRSVGVSVRQVQLNERLKSMAVLEERNRVAQEIHDGIAQLLGSLRMWADEAQMSLEEEQLEAVEAALDKIERTSRDAYASLREEMLGLRDTLAPGEDLIPVLQEYLSRYQRQWGIRTRLELEDGWQGNLHIDPAAEIQLLRIIQEGLTNVRRHAQASEVRLRFIESQRRLLIQIQDNGVGFDPERVNGDNLGLRIMRERAASVGGSIQIHSNAEQGTRLVIEIPMFGEK
jgi:signal transduction histidine kinase